MVSVPKNSSAEIQIEYKWCISGFLDLGSEPTERAVARVVLINNNPESTVPVFETCPMTGFYDHGRCLYVCINSQKFVGYLDFQSVSVIVSPVSVPLLHGEYINLDVSYFRFKFSGLFESDPGQLVKIADFEAPQFTSCESSLWTRPVEARMNSGIGEWHVPLAKDNTASVTLSQPVICGLEGRKCFGSYQISSSSFNSRYTSFPIEYSPYTITYTVYEGTEVDFFIMSKVSRSFYFLLCCVTADFVSVTLFSSLSLFFLLFPIFFPSHRPLTCPRTQLDAQSK